jgi:hypothetical protein
MDASCSVLLHTLRKMELHIVEVLEVHDVTHALHAVEYTTGGTTAFNRESCCVENDEAPVFDTDYLNVKPVYATSFANLDDGPIFNEETFVDLVFDAAPDFDRVATTVLNFATPTRVVHGQGDPDDLDNDSTFDTDTLVDGPVFDIETNYNHVITAAIEFTESVLKVT